MSSQSRIQKRIERKLNAEKSKGIPRQTVQTRQEGNSHPLLPLLFFHLLVFVYVCKSDNSDGGLGVVITAVLEWLVGENKCWVSENKGPTRCL